MKIVHYINNDLKFSLGYIYFMEHSMNYHNHSYIVIGGSLADYSRENIDVVVLNRGLKTITDKNVRRLLVRCDLFIISGVFHSAHLFALLPKRILKKTYLQFWGGDFYTLRNDVRKTSSDNKKLTGLIRLILHKKLEILLIKRSAAIITIIKEDYNQIVQITGIEKKHFTARMVGDGSTPQILDQYKTVEKSSRPIKILVGNSATVENNHRMVFRILSKYVDEDIQIICPLSYGDSEYAKKVVACGKEIFGEKFVPLTDFLAREMYYELLSSISAAIFACNRQQAMGTINALLFLGCKVYLSTRTSMWHHYIESGYNIFDIGTIHKLDIKDLVTFSGIIDNRSIYIKNSKNDNAIDEWNAVFNSCC